MLLASVAVLGLTVLLGLGLAALYLLERPVLGWASVLSLVHGALGAAGVAALGWALWVAPRAGSFGTTAAALLAGTLAAGLVAFVAHLRRRPASGLLVVIHATLGVAGYVVLAAYYSVPS